MDRTNSSSIDQPFVHISAKFTDRDTNSASVDSNAISNRRSLKGAPGGIANFLGMIDSSSTGSNLNKRLFPTKNNEVVEPNFNSVNLLKENFVSPANGTDVITHPIAVIRCANQTLCIQPKLQLLPTYDVYYCKHVGYGVRFYFLVKEGLLLHPNIRLTDDMDKAQIIVYLPVSAPWEKSECSDPKFKNKTVVLDEGDGPHLFEPGVGAALCP